MKNKVSVKFLKAIVLVLMFLASTATLCPYTVEAEDLEPYPDGVQFSYDSAKGIIIASEDTDWLDNINCISVRRGGKSLISFTGAEIERDSSCAYVSNETLNSKEDMVNGEYKAFVDADGYVKWDINAKTVIICESPDTTAYVRFDPNGGGFTDPEFETNIVFVTIGTSVSTQMPPAPEYDTFSFNGWKDENQNNFNGDTIVNSNMTVFAQWKANIVNVGSVGDIQVSFDKTNWSQAGSQRPVTKEEFSGMETIVYVRTKKTISESGTNKNFWKWTYEGNTQLNNSSSEGEYEVASFAYRGGSITIIPQYKSDSDETIKYYSQITTTDEAGVVTSMDIELRSEELAGQSYSLNSNFNNGDYEFDSLKVYDYTGGQKGQELPLQGEDGSHPMGSGYHFNNPNGDRLVIFNYIKKLQDGNHYIFVSSVYDNVECTAKKEGQSVTYAKQGDQIVISAPETITVDGVTMTFAFWTGVEMEGNIGTQITIPDATEHETTITFGNKRTYFSANYAEAGQNATHIIRETYYDGVKKSENDGGYKIGGSSEVGSQFNDTVVSNGTIYKVKKFTIATSAENINEYGLDSDSVIKVGSVNGYYEKYSDNTVIPAGYDELYLRTYFEKRASLGQDKDAIIANIKTSDDISGKTIDTINLDVKEGTLTAEQNTRISELAAEDGKEATVGTVLDLSLVASYERETQSAFITELNQPIEFSVYLSDAELAQIVDRTNIKVARIHNDTTTLLDATLTGNTLTTASDSFSAYAVVSLEDSEKDAPEFTISQAYGGGVTVSSEDRDWVSNITKIDVKNENGEILRSYDFTKTSRETISFSIRNANGISDKKTYTLVIYADGYNEGNKSFVVKEYIDAIFDGNGGVFVLDESTRWSSGVASFDTWDTRDKISATINDFKSFNGWLRTPVRDGYSFEGWYDSATGGNYYDPAVTLITDDITLYAHWTENEYKVIYDGNGGTGTMDPQTRLYSQALTLANNAFEKKGYEFIGWLDENNQTVIEVPAETAKDVTVKVNWEERSFTVTAHIDDTEKQYTVIKGYSLSETDGYADPEKTGYVFAGWNTSEDGSGTTIAITDPVNDNLVIFAQFVEKEINVKKPEIPEYEPDTPEKEVADNVVNTTLDIDVISDIADSLITEERAMRALELLENLDVPAEEVKVVVDTHLEMEVTKTTSNAEDGITGFVVDITPRYTIKATNGKSGLEKKEVDMTPEDNKLHINEDVELTIYLPESFIEGDKVWVKHNNTVFGGNEGLEVRLVDGKPCITYLHKGGFSPFEISKKRLYPDVSPSPSTPSIKLPKTGIE